MTQFEVVKKYLDQYQVQEAGGRDHLEYWIPAEEMDAFRADHVQMESFERVKMLANKGLECFSMSNLIEKCSNAAIVGKIEVVRSFFRTYTSIKPSLRAKREAI